jgi:histone deacetylase 1/2
MCHALVMNYGLYKKMEIFVRRSLLTSHSHVSDLCIQRAKPATKREMTQFHSDDYVEFLGRITPSNMHSYIKEQHKCRSSPYALPSSSALCG